jgi:hypothetical protein
VCGTENVRWHAAGVAAALIEVERIADAQQRAQALCRSRGGKRMDTPEEVLSVFARANTRLDKGKIILPLTRRHDVDEVHWTGRHTCRSRMSTAGGRMWTSSTALTSTKCGDLRPGDHSPLHVDFVHNAPPSLVEKISPVENVENFSRPTSYRRPVVSTLPVPTRPKSCKF